ncbi:MULTISPECIES: hypothetical protein [unclassified Azospirillum]|uniref:hypothetical protein n=1 Tax=unclassified Azospirillum TaxID=2630922 RepID=UPI001304B023|nr:MULTISPECIES: hypothetical protein [unclassified Azospirillum]
MLTLVGMDKGDPSLRIVAAAVGEGAAPTVDQAGGTVEGSEDGPTADPFRVEVTVRLLP